MPLSLEEYRVGQMYMIAKMQLENTQGAEGVEVKVNTAFENDEFGRGQYTHKVYHLQSKVPAWVQALAPVDALKMEEQAWNAFPYSKTVLKCPYFSDLEITMETVHLLDRGDTENAKKLSEEQLRLRKVDVIDIAHDKRDYWSYMMRGHAVEPKSFHAEKADRGPLEPGWQEKVKPVMTAYKVVTVDAPYWGYGYRLEQLILAATRALFLDSHQRLFGWIDDWWGLSIADVRDMEVEYDKLVNKTLELNSESRASLEVDETTMPAKRIPATPELSESEEAALAGKDGEADVHQGTRSSSEGRQTAIKVGS